ncbi:class II aldolase/adducin family protein [Candidatus Fermentibacteria bacterium]|nr:class II aldolase/adducin family protein [Candidatus Fermentibacteria bacterium]
MLEASETEHAVHGRIIRVGRQLVRQGLVHSCVGNISARVGGWIIISAAGAMLDRLSVATLVEVPLEAPAPPLAASSDARLHLAIYRQTSAGAIVHTHSPYAVAESLTGESILRSPDIESTAVLGGIPVVDPGGEMDELCGRCVDALRGHAAIIIRAHGVVAIGDTVEQAFAKASFAEHACRIRHLCREGRVRG